MFAGARGGGGTKGGLWFGQEVYTFTQHTAAHPTKAGLSRLFRFPALRLGLPPGDARSHHMRNVATPLQVAANTCPDLSFLSVSF